MNICKIVLPALATSMIVMAGCVRTPKLNPANIDDIVKAMTLEEKTKLVTSVCDTTAAGDSVCRVIKTCAIERLGIPSVTFAGYDTVAKSAPVQFPSPLMLACSWDPDLLESVYTQEGHQALDAGFDVLMEPSLNILRNPLSGNSIKNYSEDPLLSGTSAAAAVRGINASGTGAALRYFAAANQLSYGDKYDACITPRTLREIYLRGFEIALSQSQPAAVVASNNKINGKWASANPELLITLLRDEWKFDGAVVGAYSADSLSAAKIAAGCDLIPAVSDVPRDSLLSFVSDGRLPVESLDASVNQLLKLIVATPTFRHYKHTPGHEEPDYKAAARKAAAESVILLENRYSALPLIDSLGETIAVLEMASDSTYAIKEALEAELAQTGCTICSDADSSDVAIIVISHRSEPGDHYFTDFILTGEERSLIESTSNRLHEQDGYVVVVLNIDSVVETASWKEQPDAILLTFAPGSEGPGALADVITGKVSPSGRLTMTFPQHFAHYPSSMNFPVRFHEDFLARMRKGGGAPRGGRPGMGPGPAGLRPGMRPPRGGASAPSAAPGDTSARSRFAARRGRSFFMPHNDTVSTESRGRRNVDYTLYQEGIYVGYRFFTSFDREVSYPFGYGLGYTTFEYDDPDVILRRNSLRVFVKVTNTGKYPGREVVQAYAVTPESSLDKPLLVLVAYQKTPLLQPGESFMASFQVPFSALASFNSASSKWCADAGPYILKIGSSSTDIRSEAAVVLDDSWSQKTNDILTQQYPINELHLRSSIFRERLRNSHGAPSDTVPAAIDPNAQIPDSLKFKL